VKPQNRGCYLAHGQDIDHKTLSRKVGVTFANLNKIQCGFFQYMQELRSHFELASKASK
jgi:hypothetical protein